MKIIFPITAIIAAAGLGACVKVPSNESPSNVRFNEVVKRVKCDLVEALRHQVKNDSRFNFLTQWAAKVHMSLTVDDTATVNPGLSVVSPLSVAGTTFTFGAGGSFTGQAVRQEEYEFFLSFTEVVVELSKKPNAIGLYDDCIFPPGLLLESNFDLDTIFARALSPVAAGTLYTSHQVGPGSNSSPPLPANEAQNVAKALTALQGVPNVSTSAEILISKTIEPGAKTRLNSLLQNVKPFKRIESQTEDQIEAATKAKKDSLANAIANASKLEKDVQLVISTVVTPLYELATAANFPPKCLEKMLGFRIKAVGAGAEVTIDRVNIENGDPTKPDEIITAGNKEQTSRNEAFTNANSMLQELKDCHIPPAKPAVVAEPLYDPIDLIQETINFYITTSGSLTPSWKLVRISAPLTTPLLSGQIKNTDAIIITMGRPDQKDGKAVASGAMNNSQQAALLGQAINARLVP